MNILSENDSAMIRATETISSPSHCIRELIENSLDANSTIITIKIRESGLKLISVSDNGCGISKSDLSVIGNEGFTSKKFGSIDQCGGRGRALEAMSYLSYLTIESSDNNQKDGYILSFDENRTRSFNSHTRPIGTTVTLQVLYHSVPVRRCYYMAHKQTQNQEILDVISAYALASKAKFTFYNDNKLIFQSIQSSLNSRIQSVFNIDIYKSMLSGKLDLSEWYRDAFATYYVSSATSKSIGKSFLVVNNRACYNKAFFSSIKSQYRLCSGPKIPTVVIYVESPRETYEFIANYPLINVEFENQNLLIKIMCEKLYSIWSTSSETSTFKKQFSSNSVDTQGESDNFVVKSSSNSNGIIIKTNINTKSIIDGYNNAKNYEYNVGEKYDSIETSVFKDMDIIGQWNQAFIITKYGSEVYAIDQHAACEAQNFEKIRKNSIIEKQKLIQPLVISVSAKESITANELRLQCLKYGYEYEVKENTIIVYSIPSSINVAVGTEDLLELISILKDNPGVIPMTFNARRQMSYKACRSSVMVGDTMSNKQMKELLNRMSCSDFPWNCPHGRPTWCQLWSVKDFEEKEGD